MTLSPDGRLANGKVFADVTQQTEEGLPDGMKVDATGTFTPAVQEGSGSLRPEGKHLGTIKPTEVPANCNWGDDGRSLYMTARTGLYRISSPSKERNPY